MERVMGELNYWTDLMTKWGVGWIAGSENKAHGKMASIFVEKYISPPDYDTDALVCSVWFSAVMDIRQRQPHQGRGGTTSTEGAEGQVSFYYGEFPVI
jgi:hypothetical protein